MEIIDISIEPYIANDWICTCVYRENVEDVKVSAVYSGYGSFKHLITDHEWKDVPDEVKKAMNGGIRTLCSI